MSSSSTWRYRFLSSPLRKSISSTYTRKTFCFRSQSLEGERSLFYNRSEIWQASRKHVSTPNHVSTTLHYNDVTVSTIASQSPASRLFIWPFIRAQIKKISKLRVTGPWAENSPVTGEFPAQKASNAENLFIWWSHHVAWSCAGTTYAIFKRSLIVAACSMLSLTADK